MAYKPSSAIKPISQTNRFSVDAWAKFSMAVFKEKLDWCIVLIDGCMSQINYWCPQGKTWLIHCTYWSVQWLHVMTVCHTQTCCMWEHVSANFFFIVVLVVKADCPQPPKELGAKVTAVKFCSVLWPLLITFRFSHKLRPTHWLKGNGGYSCIYI